TWNAQLLRDRGEVREFAGAEAAGMTGEDLLHQGGARAVHTHDENRNRRGVSEPGFSAHQGGSENRSNPFELAERFALVIGYRLAPQRIAFDELMEGSFVVADIRECFRQREAELDLPLQWK